MRLATLALLFSLPAHAANWLALQGNEAAGAPKMRFAGFLQPTFTAISASPVYGLQAPLSAQNGSYSVLNLNGPNPKKKNQFQVLRAVGVVRGWLSDDLNYLAAVDAGSNGVTSFRNIVLTDLSITWNRIPGARLRAGLFKLPTSDEALLNANTSFPYVYNSNAVLNLLSGTPVRAAAPVNFSGITPAALDRGLSGFRAWGAQIYDWLQRDTWEYSYAAMLSNAGPIENPGFGGGKDLTLRLQASKIFAGQGPNREDLSIFLWRQNGSRSFGGYDFPTMREGSGIKYLRGKYRISGEYLRGSGMIVGGSSPAFAGNPYAAGVNEDASGWYLEGGWRIFPQWELDLRRDYFDYMKKIAVNEREFFTTTFGLRYFLDPNTHLMLNYEWRQLGIPNPGAFPSATSLFNAATVANNIGNRLSFQLTWSF